jgi:hypothetical protein
MECYQYRLLNLTNVYSDLNALKGLKNIYSVLDLKNIVRLNTPQDRFVVSKQICDIILNYSESEYSSNNSQSTQQENKNSDDFSDSDLDSEMQNNEFSDKNYDNMLSKSLSDKESSMEDNEKSNQTESKKETIEDEDKNNKNKLSTSDRNILEKLKKFVNGDIKKKKINKSVEKEISSLQNSGTQMKYSKFLNYKVKCLLFKSVNKTFIHSTLFPFYSSHINNKRYIDKGINLGKVLAKKLKLKNEDDRLIFNRQNCGKIDKRLIHEFGMNNEKLFSKLFVNLKPNTHFHISIDVSGSMNGDRLCNCIMLAAAFAKAASLIQSLDVVISIRGTLGSRTTIPVVYIVHDSKKHVINNFYEIFMNMSASGTTPDGLVFDSIKEIIPQASNNLNVVFLSLCDGAPHCNIKLENSNTIYYGRMDAAQHTKKCVENFRKNGITVLGYFLGKSSSLEEKKMFKLMYGDLQSCFCEPSDMTSISKYINEQFL